MLKGKCVFSYNLRAQYLFIQETVDSSKVCDVAVQFLGLYYTSQLIAKKVVDHWFKFSVLHLLQLVAQSAIDCKIVASLAAAHATFIFTHSLLGIDSNVAYYTCLLYTSRCV